MDSLSSAKGSLIWKQCWHRKLDASRCVSFLSYVFLENIFGMSLLHQEAGCITSVKTAYLDGLHHGRKTNSTPFAPETKKRTLENECSKSYQSNPIIFSPGCSEHCAKRVSLKAKLRPADVQSVSAGNRYLVEVCPSCSEQLTPSWPSQE